MALFPWQKRMVTAFEQSRFNYHGGKSELARLVGLKPVTLRQYMTHPIDKPRKDIQERIAEALDVSLEWLRDGLVNGKLVVKIVGKTAASEEWMAYDVDEQDLGEVVIDFDLEDPIAVEVDGPSNLPVYRPGDLLIAVRNADTINKKDCIVETVDGRRLIKYVVYQDDGTISLRSYNPEFNDILVNQLAKGYPIRLLIRR